MHWSKAAPLVLLVVSGVSAVSAPFRSSSDKPETVFSTGANEDEAIQKGLRLAVSQRCGQSFQSSTIESNVYKQSTPSENEDATTTNTEKTQKIRLASTTGGVIKSYKVLASGGDGAGGHTVTLEVIVEKCAVTDSDRITVKSRRPTATSAQTNVKVDPKAAVEKTVFLTIRYQTPGAGVDPRELEGVITSIAKTFALNVVKSEVMQKPYELVKAQQVRNEISLDDLNFRRDKPPVQIAEMSATVVLYGVNAEVDGSTLGNKPPIDEDTTLSLDAGFNPKTGIAFFFNKKDKSLIVLKTEKSGLAFGKLLRGDVIEEINSEEIRPNDNPSELLNSSAASGPVKLLVRRGPVSSIVVLR
jgi:hypothetical protein